MGTVVIKVCDGVQRCVCKVQSDGRGVQWYSVVAEVSGECIVVVKVSNGV